MENPVFRGLSSQEAIDRLERFGFNELPSVKKRKLVRLLFDVAREPVSLLLCAIGGIYFLIGDKQEAASLLVFLLLIVVITIIQERRTENALQALRDLSSPRALVLRDGKKRRIAGRDLVPDDIMLISEGDRVAADGRVLSSMNLAADESLLTGESAPVEKSLKSFVFAGTSIVRGEAFVSVTGTGINSEFGKIGRSLKEEQRDKSPLQKDARKLVRIFAVIASLICLCIVFIYGLTRNEWLDAVLIGMTLAMAILPNELPAVLLIFLAGGAWRISKRQVLTRKIPAIEALGSASVLCVDKTGTITQNRMTVEALWVKGKVLKLHEWGGRRLPEEYHEVLEFGVLASRIDPFDPMEQAIQNAGRLGLFESEHLHPSWGVIKEYPLTENLFAVSYVWRANQNDDDFVVGGKGAPEAIIDLCHLPELDALRVREQALEMAQAGLRVLGVAKGKVFHSLPVIQHDLDFEFLGLLGLEDPIRPEVPAFVNECKTAGIRIIMITGDHPETARSIARQIGLPASDQVLTGYDLESLDDSSFLERLKFTNIFSRMLPGQKLKIVKALKKTGEVVAMTGDGINDVPALNAADIGVAMGRRGTDVAREAASVVLMNDDFPSIIAAISLNAPIIPV